MIKNQLALLSIKEAGIISYLFLFLGKIEMTQPNFHKRRLSNTLEARSRYSTLDPDHFSEAVKLPALNSITKSVKYNDISFSFSKDLNKLRKQPEADPLLAESMVHNSLVAIRKRYDNINKQRQQQESAVKDMERLRDKFQSQKDKLESQKQQGTSKVQSMQEQLKALKVMIEQSQMQKKVMTGMMDRLKYDKVVYDQLNYNRQKQMEMIQKHKNVILKEDKIKKEEEDRTKKVYQKMVEHIEAQYGEREIHVSHLEVMIGQKVTAIEGSQTKRQEMKQIAENTLSEKDTKQKNWYKVYLCHRFVQKMLQDKMDREMRKFVSVQNAYKIIKTATGVNTAESLVSKFLNKEAEYGALLAKITNEESKIVDLKTESDALNKERRKLRSERDALSAHKHDETDLSKEEKQYNFIHEKASGCYLFEETVKTWLDRNMKKYKKMTEDKKDSSEDENKEVLDVFRKYLQILKEEVQNAGDIQEEKEIIEQVVKNHINVRVQLDNSEARLKKAEKHQKSILSQFNQEDFINDLRQETLKTNEKFMKELKKKHEELRKQKIEAEPKRKEPQAVKQPKASQSI